LLPLNATWLDVARVQLRPWRSTGVSVGRLLALTSGMRRPYGTQPAGAAAVIDTAGWRVERVGAKWVAHHHTRLTATLNLFRLAQQRAARRARSSPAAPPPLLPIRFVLMLSDGHGSTGHKFNGSCTCTREATCCDPGPETDVRQRDAQSRAHGGARHPAATASARATGSAPASMGAAGAWRRAPEEVPAAPVFATVHCRFGYDVSVPAIIDDLLNTQSEATIEQSVRKWEAVGEAVPWEARLPKAYFVGDDKAHRPKAYQQGVRFPRYLEVHRAVMCTRCQGNASRSARRPFGEHARYRAAVYAHGFHFNSVRMRRLSLMGGAVIAEESPCKEWWQLLARPHVHYAPTQETFADLHRRAEELLSPGNDAAARRMARELKALGVRAFRAQGLLDYIEALWREYARLAGLGTGYWGGEGQRPTTTTPARPMVPTRAAWPWVKSAASSLGRRSVQAPSSSNRARMRAPGLLSHSGHLQDL
jgi:hypothetical protein